MTYQIVEIVERTTRSRRIISLIVVWMFPITAIIFAEDYTHEVHGLLVGGMSCVEWGGFQDLYSNAHIL